MPRVQVLADLLDAVEKATRAASRLLASEAIWPMMKA
jgi:hypothetical protein